MALFPLIDMPDTSSAEGGLPLFREVMWNFATDRPVWRGGSPVYVTGAGAVEVWAWNAIHALRGRSELFSTDYGLALDDLTGQAYSSAVRESEAARMVRDALMINPYIKEVRASVSFSGSRLTLSCAIETIYGEVDIHGIEL